MKSKFLFISFIIFQSCYSTKIIPIKDIFDKYIGKSEHELLLMLGPATETTSNGAGGKILTYQKIQYSSVGVTNLL